MFRHLILATALLLGARSAVAQTTIPIDVRSAYLHLDPQDLANPALAIDLGALGLAPGYTIALETAGDWDAGPGGDTQTGMLGVFSGTSTLLGPTLLHRVQDAIDAGMDSFSGGTWPGNEPTEISEDFAIGRPGIEIVIPAGAKILFVTPADIYYRDNSDPDGDLGITITLVSTVSVPGDGAAVPRLALSARPNPFSVETSISFRLGEAATVRLAVHDARGRRVRTLLAGTLDAGGHVTRWDGRDANGCILPAGTYFAHLEGNGRAGVTRLILLR